MDMNDYPATLYHWNNAISDWWHVSNTEVFSIYFIIPILQHFLSLVEKKTENMRACIQLTVTNPKTTILVGNMPQVKDNNSDGEQEEK